MRVITPPIKSQGIKTKLVPWIHSLVPDARGRWIEPFLGTGVVAFNSGFREAVLGDVNPHLMRFYQAIKNRDVTPKGVREYLEREGALLAKAPDAGYAHFRAIRDRFNQSHDPLDFLFLSSSPARFILSTWHHNDYRSNPFIDSLWSKFNIVTRDHFYHSGGKIENRRSIVEALVYNFPANIQRKRSLALL